MKAIEERDVKALEQELNDLENKQVNEEMREHEKPLLDRAKLLLEFLKAKDGINSDLSIVFLSLKNEVP